MDRLLFRDKNQMKTNESKYSRPKNLVNEKWQNLGIEHRTVCCLPMSISVDRHKNLISICIRFFTFSALYHFKKFVVVFVVSNFLSINIFFEYDWFDHWFDVLTQILYGTTQKNWSSKLKRSHKMNVGSFLFDTFRDSIR